MDISTHTCLHQELHTRDEFQDDDDDDDDVFYDELRRQVLLLTAEDDGDDNDGNALGNKSLNNRNKGLYTGPGGILTRTGSYYNWPENKQDCGDGGGGAAPLWMMNLWRTTGNGTGVFIPQIVHSRRRSRSRKKNERASRACKRVERMD